MGDKNRTDPNGSSVNSLEQHLSEPSPGHSENRRRLLKGVAAATPVIMTVASRPVLGAQCTPSAWVSGNLSDHGRDAISCGGRSPGYYKTRPEAWAGTMFDPGTCARTTRMGTCKVYRPDGTPFHRFSRLRRRGVFPGHYYHNKTLMQVLWLRGHEDPYRLGAHIVAALLNAASIPEYGLSVRDVIRMYGQLARRGYYKPASGGHPMSAQEVVLFIRNTFA